jgi:hypothetical protein
MRLRPEVMGYWGDLKQRSATPQGGRAVTFAFGEWQHENFLEKETLRTSQIETPHWLVAPPDISLSCRTGGPLQSELLHSARALGAYLLLGSGSSLCEVRPKPPSRQPHKLAIPPESPFLYLQRRMEIKMALIPHCSFWGKQGGHPTH